MKDNILVRPMTATDADGVYRTSSEAIPATDEERRQVTNRSAEEVARRKQRYQHFLKHDPEGAWVAMDGDRVAGVALALVREGVWVLSLFAVAEEYRDEGLGKALLDRALLYAEGCRGAMIASSTHPAAMRRYALAGFSLQPTLMASGKVNRESLPAGLKIREGTAADLDLAARVDRTVRGSPHGPDLEFMLRTGVRIGEACALRERDVDLHPLFDFFQVRTEEYRLDDRLAALGLVLLVVDGPGDDAAGDVGVTHELFRDRGAQERPDDTGNDDQMPAAAEDVPDTQRIDWKPGTPAAVLFVVVVAFTQGQLTAPKQVAEAHQDASNKWSGLAMLWPDLEAAPLTLRN